MKTITHLMLAGALCVSFGACKPTLEDYAPPVGSMSARLVEPEPIDVSGLQPGDIEAAVRSGVSEYHGIRWQPFSVPNEWPMQLRAREVNGDIEREIIIELRRSGNDLIFRYVSSEGLDFSQQGEQVYIDQLYMTWTDGVRDQIAVSINALR